MSQFDADNSLPAARRAGISVEDLGDEILIYDSESDTAHCLAAEAALVWRACGAELSLQELVVREEIDAATVERAVAELGEKGLLELPSLRLERVGGGISRRQAVGRLAAAAGGALVVSVAAPTAWAQVSGAVGRTACSGGQCPVGFFGCKQFSACVTGTSAGDPGKRACDGGTFSCANAGRGCCPNGTRCGGAACSRCCPPTGPCPAC